MADEVGRKVAGFSRVVREADDGKGKPKGQLDFASPVDVKVVGPTDDAPTDEQIAAVERAGGKVKKAAPKE